MVQFSFAPPRRANKRDESGAALAYHNGEAGRSRCASPQFRPLKVRFGSISDIGSATTHVCFTTKQRSLI
jgi:hypothetical protein